MNKDIEQLIKKKESGDILANIDIANYYININKYDEAYAYIRELLNTKQINHLPNDSIAYYEYIYGLYLIDKRDYDEAIEYLKKSAQRDFACSNIVLGNLYEYGEHEVDKNIKKAIYYYSKICFVGDNVFCNKIHYLIKQLKKNNRIEILKDILEDYKSFFTNACNKGRYGSCIFLYDLVKQIEGKEKAKIFLRENIGYEKIIKNYIKLKLNSFKRLFSKGKTKWDC